MTSKEQKLKDLIKEVMVDAHEDEIEDVIKEYSEMIDKWDEGQLDNLLKFLKEEKERGKQKAGKGNRGRKK